MEFLWNSSSIWWEVFKKSWNIFRSENYIKMEFLRNSPRIWSEFFLRISWPRNCFGILHGFRSEFWWPVLLSNNLDDHRIIVKLVLDFIRILQELDDHGNNMTIFNDFDQNSGSQPHYQTIHMAIEFFKNSWTFRLGFYHNSSRVLIRILVAILNMLSNI